MAKRNRTVGQTWAEQEHRANMGRNRNGAIKTI